MLLKHIKKIEITVSLLVTMLILASATELRAEDAVANSCSKNDVQAAVTSVENSGGGTVYIPAGDCTWSGSHINVYGDINIIGAGKNETILRLSPDSDSDKFLYYNYNHNGESTYFRISGISFYATGRTSGGTAGAISVRWADMYRIDNCHFEGDYHACISIKNTPKGLIDHCTFKRTENYLSSSYGISPGSSYTPSDSMPKDPCNYSSVCTCQVGSAALNRKSSQGAGYTVIAKIDDDNNSAAAQINNQGGTGTGTVARLYLQIAEAGSNATVDIAAFVNEGGNSFSTRGIVQGIPVSEGKNILRAGTDFGAFSIHNGDYIGVYLNNCSLDTDLSGTASWVVEGDQIPCTNKSFGNPSIGNASIYAELFDAEGVYEQCEADWNAWWDNTERKSGFDENYVPGTDNAHFVEDCTFDWYKSDLAGNWGNVTAWVIRNNTFRHTTGQVFMGFKPGTIFAHVYNNTFEKLGEQGGKGFYPRGSGLFYNNLFKNLDRAGDFSSYRAFSDYYVSEQVRMDELYIYNNTYENCDCSEDGPDCWSSFDSEKPRSWIGENKTYFFRAPQSGERLYGFNEFVYPHPLTEDKEPAYRSNGIPSEDLKSGTTGTTVSLDTSETATCKYSTQTGVNYSVMSEFSNTGSTHHSMVVNGLEDGKSYQYCVKCLDENGYVNTDDYIISFTVRELDVTPPEITNVAVTTEFNSAQITWITDEPTRSNIEYGKTQSYGSTVEISVLEETHAKGLTNLDADTTYYYKITAKDFDDNYDTYKGDFIVKPFTEWQTPDSVHSASSSDAKDIIDGDTSTKFTNYEDEEQWVILDIGMSCTISKIRKYHKSYENDRAIANIYISDNINNWGNSLGSFPLYYKENSGWYETDTTEKKGRYLKLVSENTSSPNWRELEVYVKDASGPTSAAPLNPTGLKMK